MSKRFKGLLAAAVLMLTVAGLAMRCGERGSPSWFDGESWIHPDHCPECGRDLERLDANFVQCPSCTIKFTRPADSNEGPKQGASDK